jgi:hypothetical protein
VMSFIDSDQVIRGFVSSSSKFLFPSIIAANGVCDSTSVFANLLKFGMTMEIERIEFARQSLFGEIRGRPKNVRASYIADTLADFYVTYMRARPTYGVSEGAPSTPFCRALQELFEIFEVNMGFMGPAKAAAIAVSVRDIRRANPELNALAD